MITGMITRQLCGPNSTGSSVSPPHLSPSPGPGPSPSDAETVATVAIDCEMCDTAAGLELTRLTLVDQFGRVLLDTYVRPHLPIVNYRSQWSGITADTLRCERVCVRACGPRAAAYRLYIPDMCICMVVFSHLISSRHFSAVLMSSSSLLPRLVYIFGVFTVATIIVVVVTALACWAVARTAPSLQYSPSSQFICSLWSMLISFRPDQHA